MTILPTSSLNKSQNIQNAKPSKSTEKSASNVSRPLAKAVDNFVKGILKDSGSQIVAKSPNLSGGKSMSWGSNTVWNVDSFKVNNKQNTQTKSEYKNARIEDKLEQASKQIEMLQSRIDSTMSVSSSTSISSSRWNNSTANSKKTTSSTIQLPDKISDEPKTDGLNMPKRTSD
ncbi:MAG: hypothetical protein ACJAUP_001703 [Cellvibrionaceae bacterium]|jgi:hypothetical protein